MSVAEVHENALCFDRIRHVAKDPAVSRRESGRLIDHVTLGVLSSVIHRDIVDDVLRESGKREQRSRLLPAHVVVYYTWSR